MQVQLYQDCNTVYDSPYGSPTKNAPTPGMRVRFSSPVSGTMYVKLTNKESPVYGWDVTYKLGVHALPANRANDAVIIVGENHPTNTAIGHVATKVDTLFTQRGGFGEEQIRRIYPPHTGVYSAPLNLVLQEAVTTWAADQQHLGQDGTLTLYMVGRGTSEVFYLDKANGYQVTAPELATWLETLETARPDIRVNVVIDAPSGGSFLSKLGKDGRVIIAATGTDGLSWVLGNHTLFSAYFIQALSHGATFTGALVDAQAAIVAARPWQRQTSSTMLQQALSQEPMLDDTGDGQSTDTDGATARGRGVLSAVSPADVTGIPYISQVGYEAITDGEGQIQAQVQGESALIVWAKLYTPAYNPTVDDTEFGNNTEVQTLSLTKAQTVTFTSAFTVTSAGNHRVVVYAEDADGQQANPVEQEFVVLQSDLANPTVYLPLVQRN